MDTKFASAPGFHAGRFHKAGQPIATDTATAAEVDLDRMNKPDLLAEAARRGVTVDPEKTKAEIIAAIEAAEAA